jgi:hypothetical protein
VARVVRDTAICSLTPERLFDLLANPTERQTWDLCPAYIRQEPIDAPPGLALKGQRYAVRGSARGVPFVASSLVEEAERPFRYAQRSETTFERVYPSATATEEYAIEPHREGSLVRYTMRMTRTAGGSLLMRSLAFVLEPLTVPAAARRNFRNGLQYAEAFARR